jgi:hypothetical protein
MTQRQGRRTVFFRRNRVSASGAVLRLNPIWRQRSPSSTSWPAGETKSDRTRRKRSSIAKLCLAPRGRDPNSFLRSETWLRCIGFGKSPVSTASLASRLLLGLAVRGAPISEGCDWLPAVEQFGEGLFIHFDEQSILDWLAGEMVRARQDRLLQGFEKWAKRYGKNAPRYPSTAYTFCCMASLTP